MSLGLDRNGIALRIARSSDSSTPLRRSHAIRMRTRASMTGVAYVIVVKRAAMRQANLAAVTVAARVAAVVTNVSSGSRAAANRGIIVHNGRRGVAVNGITTVQARMAQKATELHPIS